MGTSVVDIQSRQQQNPIQSDDFEPTFRYTQTKRLRNALKKASGDFRSDTVTVPTKEMMQVGYSQRSIELLYSMT